ncbi:MAG: hypothetical protein GTO30_08515, partial [Acidobacteria bacterium]|nr:hypothetical protein [Acidobacteriota bacterium]NIQ84090.1 hypothetical protein [Acidobacteriota bacterium]
MKLLAVAFAVVAHLLAASDAQAQSNRQPAETDAAATRTRFVAAENGLAFVGQTGGMVIRDVSDPLRPVDLGWLPLPASVDDVVVAGELVFLAAGTRGLVIADVSDPRDPKELARLDTDGKVKRVARRGEHLFLADGINGLLVVDASAIESPRIVARVSTSGDLRAVAVEGDLLAVAESHGGARVLSLARPDNPRVLKKLETRFTARDACWIGDRLFVAGGREGTAFYDPRASSGRPIGMLAPVRSAQHVACDGTVVAVSNLGSAIQVFDASGPAAPRERSQLRVHRSAPIGRSGFDGLRLWIAVDVAGMGLLDLTDLDAPERVLPRRR